MGGAWPSLVYSPPPQPEQAGPTAQPTDWQNWAEGGLSDRMLLRKTHPFQVARHLLLPPIKRFPGRAPTCCVTLGKTHTFSGPQRPMRGLQQVNFAGASRKQLSLCQDVRLQHPPWSPCCPVSTQQPTDSLKSVSQARGSSFWGRGAPLTQGMLPWLLLHLAPVASFSCNCPPLSLLGVVSGPPGCPNSTSFFSPRHPPLSFL